MTTAQYIGNKSFEVVAGSEIGPGPGEVRLDVGYVGICGTDMHIYHGVMDQRVGPPQVIGHEMSGVIAEVGDDVDGALAPFDHPNLSNVNIIRPYYTYKLTYTTYTIQEITN